MSAKGGKRHHRGPVWQRYSCDGRRGPGGPFNYLPASTDTLEKVRRIEDICRDYSVPLKAAALQFPLAHPAVVSIIPGARTGGEVEENFRLVGHPIPAEFWSDLRSAETTARGSTCSH